MDSSLRFKTHRRDGVVLQELHGDEVTELPTGLTKYGASDSCKFECAGKGT